MTLPAAISICRLRVYRFPVHWGGDCESTWEAMAEAMRGALSLTISGFAYASHDIGGFEVRDLLSELQRGKQLIKCGESLGPSAS